MTNSKLKQYWCNITNLSFIESFFIKYYFLVLCVASVIVACVSWHEKFFIHAMSIIIPLAGTSMFSLFAYKYTREKLRLDLFDKRLEAISSISAFISTAVNHINVSLGVRGTSFKTNDFYNTSASAFGGVNLHKLFLLFGHDLHDVFHFLWSVRGSLVLEGLIDGNCRAENRDKWERHRTKLYEIHNNLYKTFASYVYFGDYKAIDVAKEADKNTDSEADTLV